MKDQPYIYTMPEQFLLDEGVPAHWKLYALINGFWIAGKVVYASNGWFAEKLNKSERHIRRCLETLEGLGLVDRKLEGGRIIYPGGRTPDVRGGGRRVSVTPDAGSPPISDSISDSKLDFAKQNKSSSSSKTKQTTDSNLAELDGEGMPVAPRAAKQAQAGKGEAFAILSEVSAMMTKEAGVEPILGPMAIKAIKRALEYIKGKDIISMVEDALANGKAEKWGMSLNYILSNQELNKYRAENS